MEKLTTVKQEKRSPRSSKKKPVKVVYISNPMKIKASPSEFRAVVQQHTGKYATSPPSHELAGILKKDNKKEEEEEEEAGGCGSGGVHHQHKWQFNRTSLDAWCTSGSDLAYESACREDEIMDDLIITPQMLEGFSPLFPSEFGYTKLP